jgi:hypothetical protein
MPEPPPMDGRRTPDMTFRSARTSRPAATTFARNDLLFTMSDNTRAQTRLEATLERADLVFTDETGVDWRHRWWSQTGSNRRPPACKAGALPTELWPRVAAPSEAGMVGLGRFELPTSRLSSARSNQLSYRPKEAHACPAPAKRKRGQKDAPTTFG